MLPGLNTIRSVWHFRLGSPPVVFAAEERWGRAIEKGDGRAASKRADKMVFAEQLREEI